MEEDKQKPRRLTWRGVIRVLQIVKAAIAIVAKIKDVFF